MLSALRRLIENIGKIEQSNRAITEGIANQSTQSNDRFNEVIAGLNNEQRIINDKLNEFMRIYENTEHEIKINQRMTIDVLNEIKNYQETTTNLLNTIETLLVRLETAALKTSNASTATNTEPLLRAARTYNTDHPDYDPAVVRNFPGVLLNGDKPGANPALRAVRQLMQANELNDRAWPDQLEMALAELRGIPGADELFQRKAAAEGFFLEINARHKTRYLPGWMNLDDGLFLYWLVRRLRPRVVVETGVANGFSTGLILLAMAKNGNGGKLHAIGRAEIFDANDPRWTQQGEAFGHVVVAEKKLGWMVPEELRNGVEFHTGEAQILLPQVGGTLDAIDLFFHDSDHSYDHMMFEFKEAKRKLSPNGVVVADNIAWNSSLWDFADEHGVPAYNFRGSVGAAFFG